jgi:hypothetical protein
MFAGARQLRLYRIQRIGKPNSSVYAALDQPATEGFASSMAIGSAAILG